MVLDKNPLDDIRNSASIKWVMKNGRIHEMGNHAELMDAAGYYAQLVRQHMGGVGGFAGSSAQRGSRPPGTPATTSARTRRWRGSTPRTPRRDAPVDNSPRATPPIAGTRGR